MTLIHLCLFSAFIIITLLILWAHISTTLPDHPLFFALRLEQGTGPLPGSWTYHNNQGEQNRKDQLSVGGGNKVTVVMSKSSDRLSPMMRETRSKFKKSQSIDEIDIGSYKVFR